ncbi:uncharacterized protein V1518DRAFT_410239 [Limtongia smithiae]|uniref:uncharacterized protein n=1 Tax=Limtongia smithiae TaxID=1125753 RepID=UPI0034D00440
MFRSVLSLAALVAAAQAATSVCNQTTYTATSQSDLDAIASCGSLSGSLVISDTLTSAAIDGISSIGGSLTVSNNSQINTISAPALDSIGGAFTLSELTLLTSLNFPRLASVGSIYWVTLPALSTLTFTTGVTDCPSIYISDTDLTSLDGISPTVATKFEINNNLNLDTVDIPLEYATDQIDVSYNGNTDVSFPDLKWSNNLTFQDVASVSTPSLTTVNGSYLLISNVFTSLTASNLTSVGGLTITDNDDVTSISFPELVTIGTAGLDIANNTDLENLSGFPKLTTVSGAIILEGSFTNATFPELTLVRGAVTIESDEDFDCSDFNALDEDNGIRGNDYKCDAASSSTSVANTAVATSTSGSSAEATTTKASKTTTSSSASSTSGSSASTATSTSTAGAANIAISTSGYVFTGFLTALFFGIF